MTPKEETPQQAAERIYPDPLHWNTGPDEFENENFRIKQLRAAYIKGREDERQAQDMNGLARNFEAWFSARKESNLGKYPGTAAIFNWFLENMRPLPPTP